MDDSCVVNRVTDCLIVIVSLLKCRRRSVEERSTSSVLGVRFGLGNDLSGKLLSCLNVDRIARMSFLCCFLCFLYFIFRLARWYASRCVVHRDVRVRGEYKPMCVSDVWIFWCGGFILYFNQGLKWFVMMGRCGAPRACV